jgi:malonate-semialdehyde dehydrogenase (acetylating)/methylmalonate-semialdehyde dehydrogenase
MLIDGQFVESATSHWQDVINPATQDVLAKVPFATTGEVDAAVAAPRKPSRPGARPRSAPARIFLKYQQLIRENMSELAHILTAEQGKTLPDAEGDVFRGLEVVEHAAAIGNLQLGAGQQRGQWRRHLHDDAAAGRVRRHHPFNFPAMIRCGCSRWRLPPATPFVLKPSEQDPMVTMRLVELALEAGIRRAC